MIRRAASVVVALCLSASWLHAAPLTTTYLTYQWGIPGDVPEPGDYDGDGKTDIAVYRPSTGQWIVLFPTKSFQYVVYQWGIPNDVPEPGDYDGDGKTDIAVYRPSTGQWIVLFPTKSFQYVVYQWGIPNDVPEPGDYDGDGKTDIAVYRPSTGQWIVLFPTKSFQYVVYQWGIPNDVPEPGDYDGDGKTDIAVYRPSTGLWILLLSTTNYSSYVTRQWGLATDIPVPADYDGDGRTDMAVYRPSTGVWYLLSSFNPPAYSSLQLGTATDIPVPGDYDGDGKTDVAVYRPTTGVHSVLLSTANTSAVGPQSTITCPAGAVDIWPGASIQSQVNAHAGSTTFCLRAGVHYLTSAITPKSGNTFVGEYGAVLDGSGWSTSDDTQAAFRSHNQDIDYVTIRNLVIRNMPQRGIHAYYYLSDHWTVEYNEIASSKNVGIVFPAYSTIRNNSIHHNSLGGYQAPYAHYSTLDSNEIAYNGWEQKVAGSTNATFRNNFVHHNVGAGIWYDWDNTGGLVEGNRVEDNGHIGIFYEISRGGIIRNNIVRRSGDAGVFLGTSNNTQIYNNTLDNNFRGITYFLDCPSLGGTINSDLTNNTAYDNTITVGTQSGAFASLFSYASCTTTQVAPYVNGSKNLTFSHNTYHVPLPTTGQYWLWNGTAAPVKYWNTWQALPQDATGTVSQ